MQIVIGRIEDILRCQIDVTDDAFTVLLAYNGDILALTGNLKVAHHTECLKNSESLALKDKLAGMCHITEYTNTEVHQLDGHNGVKHMSLCLEAILDTALQLIMCHAQHMHLTQHRKDDVTILIDKISRY